MAEWWEADKKAEAPQWWNADQLVTPPTPEPSRFIGMSAQDIRNIPLPFQDRVKRGDEVLSFIKAFHKGAAAHFDATNFGMSDETVELWRKHGIFADPATGRPGVLPREDEAVVRGLAASGDVALRGILAGVGGLGAVAENIAQRLGLPEPERLGRDVSSEIERKMISGDVHARIEPTREVAPARSQKVGTVPTAADFRNAADNILATKPLEPAPAGQVRLYEGYGGKFTRDRPEGATGRFVDVLEGNMKLYEKEGEIILPPEVAAKARLPDTFIMEAVLRNYWERQGIHPAELAHDAKLDPFLQQELEQRQAHPGEKAPLEAWIQAEDENLTPIATNAEVGAVKEMQEGRVPEADRPAAEAHALGADVVRGPMPDLATHPPVARDRLVDAARGAIDQLFGLGRNIQYTLDPMATGSNRAMVLAGDAINAVRRIRFEHAQIDAALHKDPGLTAARKRLGETREQQFTRMWNAADEESVALQESKRALGEQEGPPQRPEHLGLATLEPEERAMVEWLHERAQATWLHAVDSGMVEGEGLPAYTPRMVLNVAAAAEHLGPQALNELGRNVFTRIGNMKHRKYFMAEETEAAAREAVEKRMAERGATPEQIAEAVGKVQIARNIRALPLAIAKLQEAAIWHNMIRKVEDIGKAVGRDVVLEHNPGEGWFTIAGNPAFTKWSTIPEYNPVTGKWGIRTDDAGRPLMVRKPIYMPDEFKGPMHAILDESASKNKLVQGAAGLYSGLMALKGRSMLLILNSPVIHNAVVWGKVVEAVKGKEWLGIGLYGRGNRIVNGPVGGRASQLIERGFNPMGPRGSIQDITAIMENPDVLNGYHKSWTGRVLGAIPGLFKEEAGVATEKAIAKAGNFWHNTLLWDRVRDVQFGLADHLSDYLVAKGTDRLMADRVAAHFSNIVVGSIPKEAMSASSRAWANSLLFSRSFTLGNLSTYKQAVVGLPKPLLALIERDYGMPFEQVAGAAGPAAGAAIKQTVQSIARRKALSMLTLSVSMYYIGNALLEHAMNVLLRDATLDDELKGYARRYKSFMEDVKKDPFELRHLIGRLSPVYDNEPEKQDRFHIGYDKDGTAYYGRNPVGKYGEEVVGYPSHPMKMVKQKLNPSVAGFLEVLENDKGYGGGKKIPIYDEHDTSDWAAAKIGWAAAKHIVMKELPEGQIMAAVDLLHGEGDRKINGMRLVAPFFGFTVSKGAPGGMEKGEAMGIRGDFDARFGVAWPNIRKKIQAGNIEEAEADMDSIHVPKKMQHSLIRNVQSPDGALRPRTLHDLYQMGTPQQIERFEHARESKPTLPTPAPAPPAPPAAFPQLNMAPAPPRGPLETPIGPPPVGRRGSRG